MDRLVLRLLTAALLSLSAPSWAAQTKVNTGSGLGGSVSGAMGTQSAGPGSAPTLNAPSLISTLNVPLGALRVTPAPLITPQTYGLPAANAAQAAPAPPGPPNNGGSAADGGGGGPPFFVQTLIKLGVTPELALRLNAYHREQRGSDTSDLPSVLARSLEQVRPEHTDDKQRVLLIVAAALLHLPASPDSAALLTAFQAAFGFTPEQVKGLQEHGDAALSQSFPADQLPWALGWSRRLAFLDRASQALIKGVTPEALAQLQEQRDFSLLPAELKKALQLTGGPAKVGDAQAAQRYIRSIMGKLQPTARQTDALLQDYMEQKNISPTSPRGRALRQELIAETVASEQRSLAGIDPRFNDFSDVLLKLSAKYSITPAQIERLIKDKGLVGLLLSSDKEVVESALEHLLHRGQLDAITSRYQGTEQGDLMREVVAAMSARSGKSVEEIARDGVFIYSDFAGSTPIRTSVGRDPDAKHSQMVFYIILKGGKWKLSGYRQNRPLGRGDAELIRLLKNWLAEGGVPSGDFVD